MQGLLPLWRKSHTRYSPKEFVKLYLPYLVVICALLSYILNQCHFAHSKTKACLSLSELDRCVLHDHITDSFVWLEAALIIRYCCELFVQSIYATEVQPYDTVDLLRPELLVSKFLPRRQSVMLQKVLAYELLQSLCISHLRLLVTYVFRGG